MSSMLSSCIAERVEGRCTCSETLRFAAESCTELGLLAVHCSHVHERPPGMYLGLYMFILSMIMVYIPRYDSFDSGCSLPCFLPLPCYFVGLR